MLFRSELFEKGSHTRLLFRAFFTNLCPGSLPKSPPNETGLMSRHAGADPAPVPQPRPSGPLRDPARCIFLKGNRAEIGSASPLRETTSAAYGVGCSDANAAAAMKPVITDA